MFADRAKIIVRSGKGGDGHVSFRREKFVASGGPDGGDGGKGGDVVFVVDDGLNTLIDYRHRRKFSATDGEPGGKKRCHGADGQDLVLRVPAGTVIRLAETGEVIADMSGENRRQVILKGGRGGNGNMHYATSAALQDHLPAELGVVDLEDGSGFVAADIPGLIEGASQGAGLGHEFLRHIDRCKVLIHVVDAASTEGRDPVEDIYRIDQELAAYDVALSEKPQVIAANKIDSITIPEDGKNPDGTAWENPVSRLKREFGPKDIAVFPISAVTGEGLKDLIYYVSSMLRKLPKETKVYEQEYFPEEHLPGNKLSFTCWKDAKDPHLFHVEGPKIDKMLGYTNLESEKGFRFFQNFLKDNGILKELEKLGIEDGDTVKLYELHFEYYK